jgi:hypothetical protein
VGGVAREVHNQASIALIEQRIERAVGVGAVGVGQALGPVAGPVGDGDE